MDTPTRSDDGVYGGICFHDEKLYLTTDGGDLLILSSATGNTLDECSLDGSGGVGTPVVEGNRIFVVTREQAWLIRLPGTNIRRLNNGIISIEN